MDGSDGATPEQEDAVDEQLYKAQRMHVDVLLEMSEEAFLKELEPHEYHCYCGWEEAVRGWDRVAPVSCILLPQKRDKKPKPRKETDIPPSSHAETAYHADTLAMSGEQCSESQSSPRYSKKSASSSQKATLEPESAELNALDGGAEEDSSHLLHEERGHLSAIPVHLHLPTNMSKGRPAKPTKRRTKSKVVPITNFTFLPPIK
ncbi:uncharacterized protein C16orf46 homolog isoform X2 [Festucalex cinctus]